jgi:hypothetical protein
VPVFTHVAAFDQGDSSHFCERVDTIVDEAKLIYYGAKLLAKLGEL